MPNIDRSKSQKEFTIRKHHYRDYTRSTNTKLRDNKNACYDSLSRVDKEQGSQMTTIQFKQNSIVKVGAEPKLGVIKA